MTMFGCFIEHSLLHNPEFKKAGDLAGRLPRDSGLSGGIRKRRYSSKYHWSELKIMWKR